MNDTLNIFQTAATSPGKVLKPRITRKTLVTARMAAGAEGVSKKMGGWP